MPQDPLYLGPAPPAAAVLAQLYASRGERSQWLRAVLRELEDGEPAQQRRATWMLLRDACAGAPIPELVLRRCLELATHDSAWQPRLQVCQLFSRVDCPAAIAEVLLDFLAANTRHDSPFVRAWTYSALHRLRRTAPALRADVARLLRRGATDTAASVRARLRRIAAEEAKPVSRARAPAKKTPSPRASPPARPL